MQCPLSININITVAGLATRLLELSCHRAGVLPAQLNSAWPIQTYGSAQLGGQIGPPKPARLRLGSGYRSHNNTTVPNPIVMT